MGSIRLNKISSVAPKGLDKDEVKKELEKMSDKIVEYQRKMHAQGKYSLLVILQGMDASGKDGSIRHVFGKVNPLGCRVDGFKVPTTKEANHDFLWRIHKHTPQRGMVEIFNRSHYEDILVPTVEKLLPQKVIESRYEHINNFEKLLVDNDTTVLKFYLHISHEKQLEKLNERLENPVKFWKHNDGDWDSREKWDDYMKVYHKIFEKTDTKYAPWHVIPADKNRYKAYTISKLVIDAFENMDLEWPGLETDKFME